jgi:hypothetical protein
LWQESFLPMIARTGLRATASGRRSQSGRIGHSFISGLLTAALKPIVPLTICCRIGSHGSWRTDLRFVGMTGEIIGRRPLRAVV